MQVAVGDVMCYDLYRLHRPDINSTATSILQKIINTLFYTEAMKRFYILIMGILTVGISTAFGQEYVPQVREGVEWGYSRGIVTPGGNVSFFRLQFDGETEINGKVYTNLYMYDTYFLFSHAQAPIAWMREENKKVYAILNPDYIDLASEYGCMIYNGSADGEVLLMDYGVKPDESFIIGTAENGYNVVCTNVEPMQFGNQSREKFTLQVKLNDSDETRTIQVVEGVGTISEEFPGMGSIIFPFTEQLVGLNYPQPYDGWLYERDVLDMDTSIGVPDLYVYRMGEITIKSPIFDYCGIHDPTVWYWMQENGTFSGVESSVASDNINMVVSEGYLTISSDSVSLSKVIVCQPDGVLLDVIPARDGAVRFSYSVYGEKLLIVTSILSDGRKVIHKIMAR